MFKLTTVWKTPTMPELVFWRDSIEEARTMGDRAFSYKGCVAYTVTDDAGRLICQRTASAA